MSRELWSQAGEPTWAIDERLRRLEARVDQLAAIVAELAAQQAARDLAGAAPDAPARRPGPGSPIRWGPPTGQRGPDSPARRTRPGATVGVEEMHDEQPHRADGARRH